MRTLGAFLVFQFFLAQCASRGDEQDNCYTKILERKVQLDDCPSNPVRLIEAVADSLSEQSSGSFAENWLRLGIRLHDVVTAPTSGWTESLSASECKRSVQYEGWSPALELSVRAIETGLRLLSDAKEAPRPGTHAGLSMGRVLLHPCAGPETLKRAEYSGFRPHVRRYAMSGNTGMVEDAGLLQAAQALRERGECAAAVEMIHKAARAAPDAVVVWYNLQITMMECRLWDFSFDAPDPDQILSAQPAHRRSQYPGDCEDNFSIVTAASHEYFERLKNLVGSVHFWAPHVRLLVFDVGLTPHQADEARSWDGVDFRRLPLQSLPAHLSWTGWEASTYAFKPVVVWEALKLSSCVLWMDSGLELRQPPAWASRWLQTQGALLVGSGWPFPNAWVHPGTLHAHGISDPFELTDQNGRAQLEVWSGLVGFNRQDREVMVKVVKPMYQCALDRECIAPPGSNKSNHRQDQTVLSLLVMQDTDLRSSRHIFTTSKLRAFAPSHLQRVTADETERNDILVFQRRGHKPFPYHKHVRRRK